MRTISLSNRLAPKGKRCLIRQAIADAGCSVSVDIVAKICVLCAMRDTSDVVVYPREFRIIFVSRGLLECHFLVSVNRFRTVQ